MNGSDLHQRGILIFSTADWDNPFWTNKQHIATLFAKRGYRVLYVDSLGLRSPTLTGQDMKRVFKRLVKAFPLPRRVAPNVWRSSPLALPWHRFALARAVNARLLQGMLRWQLACLHMQAPLIWTYNPTIAGLCKNLPKCGVVYHCVDDLGSAPGIDPGLIATSERELGQVASLCFVTSTRLRERMENIFKHVVYEPNVCDQAFFATAHTVINEPGELVGIPHPRLLFVGALSEYKVNFALMEKLARRNHDMHWVLIGAIGEGQPGSRRPPNLPNIHILGAHAYGSLPYFMAHCDVAMLPAVHNAYTDAMFPMKFFEYLASGLPIIGTRLPALREFENLYFPCDTEQDYLAALEQVLNGMRRDAQAIDRACRQHSWEARFARMENVLLNAFPIEVTCHA